MNKLAINGGEKTVKKQKEYHEYCVPMVAEESYPVVEQLLRSGKISEAPVVKQLESEFAAYMGKKYALCTPNGTTALQAALFGAGVGPGDEVIVPSFTFWATVGPVVVNGALPVFCDVTKEGHNITAGLIEPLITKKTKAVLLVHVWGTPCDMEPIAALCKKYKIKLITDCAHAHGAKYGGSTGGIVGDAGMFSLQGSKTMPGGEGGILVTDDKDIFERAVALGHYERLSKLEDGSVYKALWLTGCGYKHRIHPVSAAIALGNLHRLDKLNAIRNKNALRLESLIKNVKFIEAQEVPKKAERVFSYHYMRYLPERLNGVSIETFLKALAAEGVVCGSCGYGRLHRSPLYTGEGNLFGKEGPFRNPYWAEYAPAAKLPVTETLSQSVFMGAPRFEFDGEENVKLFAEAYFKLQENAGELAEYDRTHNKIELQTDGRSINYVK